MKMGSRTTIVALAAAAVFAGACNGVGTSGNNNATEATPAGPAVCAMHDVTFSATAASCKSGAEELPGIAMLALPKSGWDITRMTPVHATTPAQIESFVTASFQNIQAFWGAAIKQDHLDSAGFEPKLMIIPVGQTVDTGCKDKDGNGATNNQTLLYCRPDRTMYIAMSAILADWNGTKLDGFQHPAEGEISAVYSLSHEYGHVVQDLVGVKPIFEIYNMEQEADCLSGVYTSAGFHTSSTMLSQIKAEVRFVGEPASDATEITFHGTSDQREKAFLLGYNSKNPSACAKGYEK
jgi:predicted metalloprotease